MKFLECANLSYMSALINGVDVGDCIFYANMEAYSCKSVKTDRKLSHLIERRMAEENEFERLCSPPTLPSESPPDCTSISLGYGSSLDSTPSSKTSSQLHVYTTLVLCLNHAYNYEFDFSTIPREYFRQEDSLSSLKNTINTLLERVGTANANFFEDFWQTVGDVVTLSDCDFYTYTPEEGEDPVEELEKGTLWSKHFFFFCKKQRRILLFRCWAKSKWQTLDRDAANEVSDDENYCEPNMKNIDVHFGPRGGVVYDSSHDEHNAFLFNSDMNL